MRQLILLSQRRGRGQGAISWGEMTPDSCRVAERNMGLSPRLLLSGSRIDWVESQFFSIPLAKSSLHKSLIFKCMNIGGALLPHESDFKSALS
jgi:hypothetical protein